MTENETAAADEGQDELAQIEEIEGRLAAVNARLATLLQILADGKHLGGALVGRHAPFSQEVAQEFEAVVNGHDKASGSLWDAIREAGFEVVELPESLYGALTPDTK